MYVVLIPQESRGGAIRAVTSMSTFLLSAEIEYDTSLILCCIQCRPWFRQACFELIFFHLPLASLSLSVGALQKLSFGPSSRTLFPSIDHESMTPNILLKTKSKPLPDTE